MLIELNVFLKVTRMMPGMAHSIDESGSILEVSEDWLNILGYSRKEVLGKKSLDFFT